MKRVIAFLQGASVLISGAVAMDLEHPDGIYAFMAVAYSAGLLVFSLYVYFTRNAVWDKLLAGVKGTAMFRLIIVPTILGAVTTFIMPFVSVILVNGLSLWPQWGSGVEQAFLVNASMMAIVVALFTSLKLIVIERAPWYIPYLALSSVTAPFVYGSALFFLRKKLAHQPKPLL